MANFDKQHLEQHGTPRFADEAAPLTHLKDLCIERGREIQEKVLKQEEEEDEEKERSKNNRSDRR